MKRNMFITFRTVMVLLTLLIGVYRVHALIGGGRGGGSTPNNAGHLARQALANSNGLDAWYRMDGNVLDSSRNGYSATLANYFTSPTNLYVPGKFGSALKLDGIGDWVSIPSITETGAYTVSLWWNARSNAVNATAISDNNDNVQVLNTKIGILSTGKMFVRLIPGSSFDSTINAPTINVWHLITLTRNSSNFVDLYIDGGSANRLFTNTAQSGSVIYAALSTSGTLNKQVFSGSLDDVRIYSRDLSAAEITNLYAGSTSPNCDQNCTNWWKFDETSGTNASSATPSGIAGTLTNFTFGTTDGWGEGIYSGGLSFTGTDYISIPGTSFPAIGNDITMSVWIKPTLDGNGATNYTLFGQSVTASAFHARLVGDGSLVAFTVGSSQLNAPANTVSSGVWSHVTYTRASSPSCVDTWYVNGVKVASTTPCSNLYVDTTNAKQIGQRGNSTEYFNGGMDDFRLYNRALTGNEVYDQYIAGSSN